MPIDFGIVIDRTCQLLAHGHCRGVYARDRAGNPLLSPLDPDAVVYDLYGALTVATKELAGDDSFTAYTRIIQLCYDVLKLPQNIPRPPNTGTWLSEWMDEPNRTSTDEIMMLLQVRRRLLKG